VLSNGWGELREGTHWNTAKGRACPKLFLMRKAHEALLPGGCLIAIDNRIDDVAAATTSG
jgi:hypothetical protein